MWRDHCDGGEIHFGTTAPNFRSFSSIIVMVVQFGTTAPNFRPFSSIVVMVVRSPIFYIPHLIFNAEQTAVIWFIARELLYTWICRIFAFKYASVVQLDMPI